MDCKPVSSVTDRVVKGTAWLGLASMIVNALSVISTFVLARLLSPADFGLVALGTTMMLIITEITELSLAQALVRHQAPTREHFDTAWSLNALRGFVLSTLFAAAAAPISRLYEDARLIEIILALAASIFLGSLANPYRVMLTRNLIFWQDFALNVGQKIAGVAVSISVAYVFRSYWALVAGILATQIVNIAISYIVYPYAPRFRLVHTRELFSFSAWLTAARVVDTLNWRFDTLFAGKMLGSVSLGHYSFGGTLAAIPTRETTTPLRQTFFPAFASMQGDNRRMAAAYQRGQAVLTAIAMPAGLGAALVADPLIRLVMGEKWVPAIFIVQALSVVFALQTIGSAVDSVCMAQGQTRLLFVRGLQMLAVRVPVIIAATTLFGIVGLVFARAFTGLLTTLLNMLLARRLVGVSLLAQLGANARSLIASVTMAAAALGVESAVPFADTPSGYLIEVIAVGTTALATYVLVSFMLWTIRGRPAGPEHEISELAMKIIRKFKKASAQA